MKRRSRTATHTSLALIVVAGCAAWTLLVVALWARHRPQAADADEDGDRRPRTAAAVFEEAWRKAAARERSQLESLGFPHGHALAVASRLRSGDAVWEWGSGGSGTGFFFGRFVRAWHGVVSERPSYSWRAKGVVQLRHVKLDGGNSVASYVDAIAKDALPCFDRVLVDGTAREACAQRALRSLCNKTDSLVIVHDFYDPARASEHSAMLKHYDIVESFPAEGTGIVFLAPRR